MHLDALVEMAIAAQEKKAQARGRRFKLRRTPRPAPPTQPQREYFRELRAMVAALKAAINQFVRPHLAAIIEQANSQRPTGDSLRADDFTDLIEAAFNSARLQFYRKYSDQEIANLALRAAGRLDTFNLSQLNKVFGAVTEIKIPGHEPWLKQEIKAFTKNNVSLIKSIPEQSFSRIEQQVTRAAQRGILTSDLSKTLQKEYDVTENRAKLIARDQLSKFNSDLTQSRQKSVGVTKYTWSTSMDERVRDSHAEKEGKVFSWNDPPADTGHPGEDYNCRCELGSAKVSLAGKIQKIFRRKYEGEIITVKTASGRTLQTTPNHPVLTDRGWLPLCEVNIGADLIRKSFVDQLDRIDPEPKLGPATLAEAFDLALSLGCPIRTIRGADLQFHGDGREGEVDIILLEGELSDRFHASLFEQSKKLRLPFSAKLKTALSLYRAKMMGFVDLMLSLVFGHVSPFHQLGSGLAAPSDASFSQYSGNNDSLVRASVKLSNGIFRHTRKIHGDNFLGRHFEVIPGVPRLPLIPSGIDTPSAELLAKVVRINREKLSDLGKRFPFGVQLDRVVEKSFSKFSGHVFNLQTEVGYYFSDGIASHNCVAIPVFPGSEGDEG